MARAEIGFRTMEWFRESKGDSGKETEEMTNRDLNDTILLLEKIVNEVPLKSKVEAEAVGRTIGVCKRILRQRLLSNMEKKG